MDTLKEVKFGVALEALKDGKRAQRTDSDTILQLKKGSDQRSFDESEKRMGIRGDLYEFGGKGTLTRLPHIEAFYGEINVGPYAFSHEDILAEDWIILD